MSIYAFCLRLPLIFQNKTEPVGNCVLLFTPPEFNWAHLICASVCMHTYVFVYVVTHTCTASQPASMHVCVFFSLSTPCHLPPSLCSSPPSLLAVQLGEADPESKVQVCRLADESQRGSFPPTVCKYVVTLIERSSSSLQLSFLLFLYVRVWVFVCVKQPQLEQQKTHATDTHHSAKSLILTITHYSGGVCHWYTHSLKI